MVVVKIELWPNGDESKAKEIGRMEIVNDGTGTQVIGSYTGKLRHAGAFSWKPGFWKQATKVTYRRTLSPYHLVARVLKSCGIQ